MRTNVKVAMAGAAAVVALAAGSTVAIAAVSGGFGSGVGSRSGQSEESMRRGPGGGPYAGRGGGLQGDRSGTSSACSVPSLPGSVVDVTLTDMGGGMMGGGSGRNGYGGMGGGMMGSGGAWSGMGGMSVQVSPVSVSAGTVSLKVANDGWLTHELVVLPLAAGAQPGQRSVGSNGEVSEDGSLGEASATCAAGEGEGIASGSDGWVTLDLKPGRYELICNLPGHYEAGMYAELDVVA